MHEIVLPNTDFLMMLLLSFNDLKAAKWNNFKNIKGSSWNKNNRNYKGKGKISDKIGGGPVEYEI